jgi:hypothetical protein
MPELKHGGEKRKGECGGDVPVYGGVFSKLSRKLDSLYPQMCCLFVVFY